eukprot:617037-Pleurochrysis_carterae.AAC.1
MRSRIADWTKVHNESPRCDLDRRRRAMRDPSARAAQSWRRGRRQLRIARWPPPMRAFARRRRACARQ